MNKLDDKVVIRKSHLAALCGMLNSLNQNQDRVANEAVRLLDHDLTGWAAVPVEPTDNMDVFATEDWLVQRALEDRASAIWQAMLEASPPLPGGGE